MLLRKQHDTVTCKYYTYKKMQISKYGLCPVRAANIPIGNPKQMQACSKRRSASRPRPARSAAPPTARGALGIRTAGGRTGRPGGGGTLKPARHSAPRCVMPRDSAPEAVPRDTGVCLQVREGVRRDVLHRFAGVEVARRGVHPIANLATADCPAELRIPAQGCELPLEACSQSCEGLRIEASARQPKVPWVEVQVVIAFIACLVVVRFGDVGLPLSDSGPHGVPPAQVVAARGTGQ